jgi:hypothetical protein
MKGKEAYASIISHSIVFDDNVRLQIQTLEWALSEIDRYKERYISICLLDQL